ncbi:E3 ubiquitin-protein ligase MARCHF3-like isoform X2 [Hermetia illucens]|uniref:E3 ubiquitin-protein ligase MARCHF3-like isoform X2 n=1 Tax=Hermetia illucens TaxID=343691 RepID=UPI0018CBF3DF|nr:E3 ubiquitin-protein ligase MARCHF3-like isoform X2 [Hermetia illucens]
MQNSNEERNDQNQPGSKLEVAIPEAGLRITEESHLPPRNIVEYVNTIHEQAIIATTNERNDIVVNIPIETTRLDGATANIMTEPSTQAGFRNITHSVTCTISIRSVGSVCCRICHNTDGNDRLISPCLCKGTLAHVHQSCLEHWLSTSGMVHCELCQYRFPTEETLRYTFCQSIRIWYRHPNNRGLLQADCLVCTLLTVVTFGLVAICMLGLQYFNLQSYRLGVSRLWTQGSIIVFLVIVIFAYCINLFLIVKSQIVPWYRWWQSARSIKLVLVDRRATIAMAEAQAKKKVRDVEREIQSTALTVRAASDEGNSAILPMH